MHRQGAVVLIYRCCDVSANDWDKVNRQRSGAVRLITSSAAFLAVLTLFQCEADGVRTRLAAQSTFEPLPLPARHGMRQDHEQAIPTAAAAAASPARTWATLEAQFAELMKRIVVLEAFEETVAARNAWLQADNAMLTQRIATLENTCAEVRQLKQALQQARSKLASLEALPVEIAQLRAIISAQRMKSWSSRPCDIPTGSASPSSDLMQSSPVCVVYITTLGAFMSQKMQSQQLVQLLEDYHVRHSIIDCALPENAGIAKTLFSRYACSSLPQVVFATKTTEVLVGDFKAIQQLSKVESLFTTKFNEFIETPVPSIAPLAVSASVKDDGDNNANDESNTNDEDSKAGNHLEAELRDDEESPASTLSTDSHDESNLEADSVRSSSTASSTQQPRMTCLVYITTAGVDESPLLAAQKSFQLQELLQHFGVRHSIIDAADQSQAEALKHFETTCDAVSQPQMVLAVPDMPDEHFSYDDLAKLLDLNPSAFMRLFKDLMEQSPSVDADIESVDHASTSA